MMRFYLHSLGCKVNVYELSAIRAGLLESGHVEEKEAKNADLIVINTCSVTATADQKSRQHIRRYRKAAPKAILAVMGCYSEKHAAECLSFDADIVLGTSTKSKLIEAVESVKKEGKPYVEIDEGNRRRRFEELGAAPLAEAARAYIKIQDGCDNFCAYCLIPYLRGNSRSRSREMVLLEAKRILEQGYREIVVTGIHTGAYGKDLGKGDYRLCHLIKDLSEMEPKPYRIRISSLEDTEIDDDFIEVMRSHENIARHLHLPLQSGSSSVLKRMNRKYDTAAYKRKIDELREKIPGIAITTDVIVGFPGESEEEWKETLSFVEEVGFAEIHVFPFSSREGTAASRMKGHIDPATKERRVHELLELSRKGRRSYEEKFFGQEMEVLFETYDESSGLAYGHTSNYILVKKQSDRSLHGEVQSVLIDENSIAD